MTRNMNWKAKDLNNVPFMWEFLAYLDQPLDKDHGEISDRFRDMSDNDKHIYDITDNVKQEILVQLLAIKNWVNEVENRVNVLEDRVTVVENRVTVVEDRVNVLENRVNVVENRVNLLENRTSVLETRADKTDKLVSSINARMAELERCQTNKENEPMEASESAAKITGILRETTRTKPGRVRFDDRAIRITLIPSRFESAHGTSGEDCLFMTDTVMFAPGVCLGVLPSPVGSQLGFLHNYKALPSEQCTTFQSGKIVPVDQNGGNIVVLGRTSGLELGHIRANLSNMDVDFEDQLFKVVIAVVDWRQETDSTFTGRVVPLDRIGPYKEGPSRVLPVDTFWNKGSRFCFDQATIMGHAVKQPGCNPSWETSTMRHGTIVRANFILEDKAMCAILLGSKMCDTK